MIQAENLHTQRVIDGDALPPYVPSQQSEEIHVRGLESTEPSTTVEAQATPEVPIAAMLDSFFDNYTAFVNDPSPKYIYELPAKNRFDTGVYREFDRAEVADQKLADLRSYINVAFREGHLAIDPAILPTRGIVTVDSICDAIVTDSLIRAQVRFDEQHPEWQQQTQPGHIVVEAEAQPDADNKTFFDMMKGFGSKAMQALSLHSGEVTLPPTKTLPTVPVEVAHAK